ncbi:MAG: cold-shock protein [Actinomycetota bacterium]
MAQGTIKHYDEDAHSGSLLLENGTEIAIDGVSTQGSDLRTLRLGQRVRFDIDEVGGTQVARKLHILTF